jgi:hypothetical protein
MLIFFLLDSKNLQRNKPILKTTTPAGVAWCDNKHNTVYNKSQQSKKETLPSHLNNDRILLSQPGQVPRDPMDEVVAKRLQIAPPEYLFFKKIYRTGPLYPCSGILDPVGR